MLRVLAIGGLDPCGGAGLAADLRMVHTRGGMPLAVATALTVQNRHGMQQVHPVEPAVLEQSLAAVVEDGPLHAVKTGLFGSPAQLRWIAGRLQHICAGIPLVVDPVLSATAGGWSAGAELVRAYRESLLPLAAVATPNLEELERLVPGSGAAGLLADGTRAVLVKGGHGAGDVLRDVLHTAGGQREFTHPRAPVGPVHGTGCALAAALATYLAAGHSVPDACSLAISDLQRCLRAMRPSPDGLPQPLCIDQGPS